MLTVNNLIKECPSCGQQGWVMPDMKPQLRHEHDCPHKLKEKEMSDFVPLSHEVRDLRRQLAEASKDAERYRWLCANKLRYNGVAWHWHPSEPLFDPDLNAAIDAAIAAESDTGGDSEVD